MRLLLATFITLLLIGSSQSIWWFESTTCCPYWNETTTMDDCLSFDKGCNSWQVSKEGLKGATMPDNKTLHGKCIPRWDADDSLPVYTSYSTACKSMDLVGLVVWFVFWSLTWALAALAVFIPFGAVALLCGCIGMSSSIAISKYTKRLSEREAEEELHDIPPFECQIPLEGEGNPFTPLEKTPH